MKFSFIIPVYNCTEHLDTCVHSILDGAIPSSEIILIDDGSTDGSGQLCDDLAKKHSSIRVVHQGNAGVSAARNAGLAAASGEYILFVDGDDTLDASALREILVHPNIQEADLTIFGMEFHYFHYGRVYKREFYFYKAEGILPEHAWGDAIVELFQSNALSSMCNKIFKRKIIEKHKLRLNPSLSLYEDLDFVMRYLCFCQNIGNVPQPIYQYRLTENYGHVRHRMARIDNIPAFLVPIEKNLSLLRQFNSTVTEESCQRLLQMLYIILVREKLTVSNFGSIRKLCQDYILWQNVNIAKPDPSPLRSQMVSQRIFSIWLQQKAGTLRHRLGIWYRWVISQTGRKPYGC